LGGSNTVAFNDEGVGVLSVSSTDDEISRSNMVFSNVGIGIDLEGSSEDTLGNTANGPGDADAVPNDLQNKPIITAARTSSAKTTVQGKAKSKTGRTYTIEFNSNPTDTNEGKTFIGKTTVETRVDELRSFTFSPDIKVPMVQTIPATATDASIGDTSEFSSASKVVAS